MKKLIIITGTPGTGKSTLARAIAKKYKLFRLDLHKYYQKVSVSYNKQKQCYDVDLQKLEQLVQKTMQEHPQGVIFDSHISHLLPKRIVQLCIVLTCSNLKELEKRLKRRKYSQAKIKENLEAEIFQVCLEEAQERGHKIKVIDTSLKPSTKMMLQQILNSKNRILPP